MSNVEVLNTVDLDNAQTEESENTTAAQLSEEQLDNVNAGYGIRFEADGDAESRLIGTTGFRRSIATGRSRMNQPLHVQSPL
jgi:phosphoribosylformimino-5-aminoimidazole carboxamide ribonucleotide (ProFAR) isomerase